LVGDFNRDGWLDLIMIPWMYGNSPEELENSVFVYFGGKDGFSDDRRSVLPAYITCSNSAQLGDVNNDGYLDFLYGDNDGFVGVYYGGPDGFDRSRFGKIPLKDWNGALIMGITVADVDRDGWLELFVTTAGHYTRRPSHLYVMRDGEHGFPPERMTVFETGGTTGFPDLADLTRSGHLDLLLPFYSTTETRELPARIFRGDGAGDFDWENPIAIDCLASIAFCPVDLSHNGYPDLFICCHRNDLGHMVNSKLILNGPDGLATDDVQDLLGYGPHCFTNQNQSNLRDRSDAEYYTSPAFECHQPRRIAWEGETPFKTSLTFRVRFGRSARETSGSAWSEPVTCCGSDIHAPADARYMQYEVTFRSPSLVNSPRLASVTVECE
jgi:hypothetical protein